MYWYIVSYITKYEFYIHFHYNTCLAINGCVSPRVALEMTFNRTANRRGLTGHNLALDLQCEHANKQFQGIC